jgi:hypothetical protein
VVVELHARDRRLREPHLGHRLAAQDDQLWLHEIDDLVAHRELGAGATLHHRELPTTADPRLDEYVLARRVEGLRAVPRRHLVGIDPRREDALARRFEDARDEDLLVGRGGHGLRPLLSKV